MKYIYILIICLFSVLLQAQRLTIDEALEYLQIVINTDLHKHPIYEGDRFVLLERYSDQLNIKYCWSGNEDITFNTDTLTPCNSTIFSLPDLESIQKVIKNEKYIISASCENERKDCFTHSEQDILLQYAGEFFDSAESTNHYSSLNLFYFNNELIQEIVYNVLQFVIYELQRENEELELELPFSDRNTNAISSIGNNVEVIKLSQSGGVSTLEANLAGFRVEVILDSGASDVSIPKILEEHLIKSKAINASSYLTPAFYTIANGDVVASDRFIMPFIEVDGIKVKKVQCSVNQSDDIILLGKSFLNRFKSWKLDNELNHLILEY